VEGGIDDFGTARHFAWYCSKGNTQGDKDWSEKVWFLLVFR
jgi:hypothetical protein